jgi:hypothetical protein
MRPLRKRITETKNMYELMFELASTAIAGTPRALKDAPTDRIYTGPDVLEDQIARLKPTYAATLEELLRAEKPPSRDWVKDLPDLDDLPTHGYEEWLCYAIMMSKLGEPDLFYPGSGTDVVHGAQSRWKVYQPWKTRNLLPAGVKVALENGYHISSMGWLCSIPMPQPGAHLIDRAFVHIMETVFTFVFGGMQSRKADYRIGHLMVWDLQEFEYLGLATHSPLTEPLRGVHEVLTPEQLAEVVEQREVARKARSQKEMQRVATLKETQPEAYAERSATRSLAGKARSIHHIEANTYACEPCKYPAPSQDALDRHLLSLVHAAKIKELGIEDPAKVDPAKVKVLRDRADAKLASAVLTRKRALEEETHACKPCGKVYGTPHQLQHHMEGPEHAQMERDLEFGVDEVDAAERARKKRVNDTAARSRKRIKEAKTHYCADCDHPCTSSKILEQHKTSKKHLKKVAENLAATTS